MLLNALRFIFISSSGVCYGFTPVRSLVTSQAFASSVINTINQEFVIDNDVVKDIFQHDLHLSTDIFYTMILGYTIYLQYNFQINKKNWDNIELYSSIRRRTNSILTILFIIFIKNVDNAI